LIDPAVEAANNRAEQALRGAVVTRKPSFGSRSKRGSRTPLPHALGDYDMRAPEQRLLYDRASGAH